MVSADAGTGRAARLVAAGTELDVVVESRTQVAEDVIALALRRPDGAPLPRWEPGAHVDALLPLGVERQYSLCGEPADETRWVIAVLREHEGRGGSEWIHDELRVGDPLRVRGPRNNFPLVPAAGYVFIAGGIGITPLLPMIRRVDRLGAGWELLYGGRRRASMSFVDDLAGHGDRVTIWPQDERGLLELDACIGRPRAGTAVYCCGPEPLIAAVEERCCAWPAGALHVERFHPRPDAQSSPDGAFEVSLVRSGLDVVVAPGESIVEALERAGVDVITSCREGTCGTCETTVIDGSPDHRDSILTDEERAANDIMMICCSRSLTPRLVLDL